METGAGISVSVVIVAAGKGTRMNMDINKQYVDVCGKPVIARTIQAFEDCDSVNEIILVVNEADIMYCKKSIIDLYGFEKVKSVVAGGSERQNSVYNGLKEAKRESDIILIHDGARPFVREETIMACIEAARGFGAACAAVPVKDTIKKSDKDGFIAETLERNVLWSIQTPQAFKYDIIMEAHKKAEEEGYTGTDDAILAERLGVCTKLVMGRYDNIKITTKEDLAFADAIIEHSGRL
ncbi:MAG: 2-C-methyl-D-erythritol 4-phosphate cytidylyltransferase [Clostridia bacterium]|nr:2-C-methyl-D-erythritol 4-phosphate cytidylyltransferase [Clostridia bacterium]